MPSEKRQSLKCTSSRQADLLAGSPKRRNYSKVWTFPFWAPIPGISAPSSRLGCGGEEGGTDNFQTETQGAFKSFLVSDDGLFGFILFQ